MTTPSSTIRQLFPDHDANAVEGLVITGVTSDSREVEPGYLFAALEGSVSDGRDFVPDALHYGAAAILTGPDGLGGDLGDDVGVPVLRFDDPRRALALGAARFYGRQPETIAAVTGTSGKTSIVSFLRQIWLANGHSAGSLGTLGLMGPDGTSKGSLTTPDPVSLQRILAELADEGVSHLAMEASSHGLDQRRLDGVRLRAAAFTNLSRDHLDYHASMADYMSAKLRLFDTLLPENGVVVVNADDQHGEHVVAVAEARGLECLTVGRNGQDLRLKSVTRMPDGARLLIEAGDETFYTALPLVGDFQISNALVAAGLAIATGTATEDAVSALDGLSGVSGRLELIGTHPVGARVFVDYSHKPEALVNVLKTLRDHAERRLVVVFGAGGDRDPGKRQIMGAVAKQNADRIIVTDDNPRSEEPSLIRRAILQGAPGAEEIGDRRTAIRTAIADLEKGDVLVIAGKGHETGQIVGDDVLPFSDQDEARRALGDLS